jgi:hypothetical protein
MQPAPLLPPEKPLPPAGCWNRAGQSACGTKRSSAAKQPDIRRMEMTMIPGTMEGVGL